MVIEWLKFQVPPEKWEEFIQRDEEVWTAGLRSVPGFLGK
ncbi:MAG: TIGR03792 family protein [Microcoleus sp.]